MNARAEAERILTAHEDSVDTHKNYRTVMRAAIWAAMAIGDRLAGDPFGHEAGSDDDKADEDATWNAPPRAHNPDIVDQALCNWVASRLSLTWGNGRDGVRFDPQAHARTILNEVHNALIMDVQSRVTVEVNNQMIIDGAVAMAEADGLDWADVGGVKRGKYTSAALTCLEAALGKEQE